MNNKITFEAMPLIVARLEEKLDALTETVGKLFQCLSPPTCDKPEEMVAITEAANILHLSVSRVRALVQEGRVPCYKPGEIYYFCLRNSVVGCLTASVKVSRLLKNRWL